MPQQADLIALVGSRICHDLVSPLGAIGNGVELLELGGAPAGPELSLIAESVASAHLRLNFFRLAFGPARDGQTIAATDIQSALPSAGACRVGIDWRPRDAAPRAEVKAAFLAILCLESAMIRGGDITVTREGAGWMIRAAGGLMRPDPRLWEGLRDPQRLDEVTPAQVQFALLPGVMTQIGRHLTAEITPEAITLWF